MQKNHHINLSFNNSAVSKKNDFQILFLIEFCVKISAAANRQQVIVKNIVSSEGKQ